MTRAPRGPRSASPGCSGLVALAVASRGGRAATRTVEWLTYATWAAVVLHAAGPGSELDGRWGLAVVAGGIGLLAAAAAYRAAGRAVPVPEERPEPAPPAPPPPRATPHQVPSPLWSRTEPH